MRRNTYFILALALLAATACRQQAVREAPFQGRLVYESEVKIVNRAGDDTPQLLLAYTVPKSLDLLIGYDRILTRIDTREGQWRHLADLRQPALYLLDAQRRQVRRIVWDSLMTHTLTRAQQLGVQVVCKPDTLLWNELPCQRHCCTATCCVCIRR